MSKHDPADHDARGPRRRDFLKMTAASAVTLPALGGCSTGDSEPAPGEDPGPAPPTDEDPTVPPDEPSDPPDDEPTPFDPEAIPQDDVLFPNANLAGNMTASGAFLAGYFGDARAKWLRVWQETEDPGQIRLVVDQRVEPDEHGYAQVSLSQLAPGAWYRYAYFEGSSVEEASSRSLIAAFRTAPAADSSEPMTIAISACNGGYYDPARPPAEPFQYPALETTAGEYYDAFVHLGDQAYLDEVFAAGGAYETYLEGWKSYLGSQGMRDCYARAGMYCTWDDHEITDNSAVDPWSMAPADVERIRNAKDAYFRVMPLEPIEGAPRRLWRRFRWGTTVEFFLLDSRYERDRPSTGQYLSSEQMQWLKEGLAASPCRFKCIGNSVPVTDMNPLFDVVKNDRWEGYERQRDELLGFIGDRAIDNVYFISGDLHLNFVARVNRRGNDLGSRAREIAVTGGNVGVELGQDNFDYLRAQPRAVLMTFDPSRDLVNVRFLEPGTGRVDYEADIVQANDALVDLPRRAG